MCKTVDGAEPLRAVGTSLSGPAFDKCHMRTRHGLSDRGQMRLIGGFVKERFSAPKILSILSIVSKISIVTKRLSAANLRPKLYLKVIV